MFPQDACVWSPVSARSAPGSGRPRWRAEVSPAPPGRRPRWYSEREASTNSASTAPGARRPRPGGTVPRPGRMPAPLRARLDLHRLDLHRLDRPAGLRTRRAQTRPLADGTRWPAHRRLRPNRRRSLPRPPGRGGGGRPGGDRPPWSAVATHPGSRGPLHRSTSRNQRKSRPYHIDRRPFRREQQVGRMSPVYCQYPKSGRTTFWRGSPRIWRRRLLKRMSSVIGT